MRKIISARINKIHNFAAQSLEPQYGKLPPTDWRVKKGRKNLSEFLEGAINSKEDSQREYMKIVLLAHAELLTIDLKFYTWIKLLFMGDLKSEEKSLIEIYGGEEPVFQNAMANIKNTLVNSRLRILDKLKKHVIGPNKPSSAWFTVGDLLRAITRGEIYDQDGKRLPIRRMGTWDKKRVAKELWKSSEIGVRKSTLKKINNVARFLVKEGLCLSGVPSDGHCWFWSFAESYKELRGNSKFRLPLLDKAIKDKNEVNFLRGLCGSMLRKKGKDKRAKEIETANDWVYSSEGALLSQALRIPIRVTQVSDEGISDYCYPITSNDFQLWGSLKIRPKNYIHIVDLESHFVLALKWPQFLSKLLTGLGINRVDFQKPDELIKNAIKLRELLNAPKMPEKKSSLIKKPMKGPRKKVLTEDEVKEIEKIKKTLKSELDVKEDELTSGRKIFYRLYFREPRYNRKEYWERSLKQVRLIHQFFSHYRIFGHDSMIDHRLREFELNSSSYEKKIESSLQSVANCTVTTCLPGKPAEKKVVDVLDLIQVIWHEIWADSLSGELKINGVDFKSMPRDDLAMMINGLGNIYRVTFKNSWDNLEVERSVKFNIVIDAQLGVEIVKGIIRKKNIEKLAFVKSARELLDKKKYGFNIEMRIKWLLEIYDVLVDVWEYKIANKIWDLVKEAIDRTFPESKETNKKREFLLGELYNRMLPLNKIPWDVVINNMLGLMASERDTVRILTGHFLKQILMKEKCFGFQNHLNDLIARKKNTIRKQVEVFRPKGSCPDLPGDLELLTDLYNQTWLTYEFLKAAKFDRKKFKDLSVYRDKNKSTKFFAFCHSLYRETCDVKIFRKGPGGFEVERVDHAPDIRRIFLYKERTLRIQGRMRFNYVDVSNVIRILSKVFGANFTRKDEIKFSKGSGFIYLNLVYGKQMAVEAFGYDWSTLEKHFKGGKGTEDVLKSGQMYFQDRRVPRSERVRSWLELCHIFLKISKKNENKGFGPLLRKYVKKSLIKLRYAIDGENGFIKELDYGPDKKFYKDFEQKLFNRLLNDFLVANFLIMVSPKNGKLGLKGDREKIRAIKIQKQILFLKSLYGKKK